MDYPHITGHHKAEAIIEDSYVDIYLAGGLASLYCPYLVEHVGYASQRGVEKSGTYMLDSNITDESTTNGEVIEKARSLGADRVVPVDYMNDRHRTTESLKEFLSIFYSDPFDCEVVYPLHPPFEDHIETVIPIMEDWGGEPG